MQILYIYCELLKILIFQAENKKKKWLNHKYENYIHFRPNLRYLSFKAIGSDRISKNKRNHAIE